MILNFLLTALSMLATILIGTGVKTHEVFMFGFIVFMLLNIHDRLDDLKNLGK